MLEYAAFYAPIDTHATSGDAELTQQQVQQMPPNPQHLVAPRPPGGQGRGTRLELHDLHSGTTYMIHVRGRTNQGWGPPSESLLTRTMRPRDFPAPLRAPTVAKVEGCNALRLRLPVLECCSLNPPTKWDVEVARGGEDDWRVLVPDTPGGYVSAVGMDAYAAARFRLSSRAVVANHPEEKVTYGEPTAPLLPGSNGGAAGLLHPPRAVATSSASVRLSWGEAGDESCRPQTEWELQYTRDEPQELEARRLAAVTSARPMVSREPSWRRRLGSVSCNGVTSSDGSACCAKICGTCGGAGCSGRPGGAARCCPGWKEFDSSARLCAMSNGVAPCFLDDLSEVACARGLCTSAVCASARLGREAPRMQSRKRRARRGGEPSLLRCVSLMLRTQQSSCATRRLHKPARLRRRRSSPLVARQARRAAGLVAATWDALQSMARGMLVRHCRLSA